MPVEDLTCKFKHLGSLDGTPPSSSSPKATILGGNGPVGGTQRFSENGRPEDLFNGGTASSHLTSDLTTAFNRKMPTSWPNDQGTRRENLFSPSQAASYSPLDSPQIPETVATRRGVGMLSPGPANIEGGSRNPEVQRFPLSNNNSNGMATDTTSTRSLNYKTATSRQRENSLPRNQEIRTTLPTLDPIIVDDGKQREKVFFTSETVHNETNGSTKVIFKTNEASEFDLTSALRIRVDKGVLGSSSQTLRPQTLHTPGETTARTLVSTVPKAPPLTPSSNSRATTPAAHVRNSAQVSVTSASELATRTPGCALSKSLKDKRGPMSCPQRSRCGWQFCLGCSPAVIKGHQVLEGLS